MRRLFYVLLTISGLIAMEKEKERESPATARLSQQPVNELISKAFSCLTLANDLYAQAQTEEKPNIFNESKYEQAQRLYIQAHKLFFHAGKKGHEHAHAMAYLTYENKIVPIECLKVETNIAYSTAPGWMKTVKNQESIKRMIPQLELELDKIMDKIPADWLEAFDNKKLNPKESIIWQQALEEVKNKPMPPEKHKKEKK